MDTSTWSLPADSAWRTLREATAQILGVFIPHYPPAPQVVNVRWTSPRGCMMFSLQKELAHLQLPGGNLVRSISVTPAQAQALSLGGFALQQIQHVLSKIQSHLVQTLAQWGVFSTIVTLKMPQDKEFTTFRV